MKKFLLILISLFICEGVFAKNISGVWQNDARTLFRKNNAIIYGINIRTFNAKDTNNNGLIDDGEESGNFINAIPELDNLAKTGINTIHVMPINKIGKIKAFGTAGSLYALSSLTEINPQLVSKTSNLSPIEQAKLFVKECHKRNIRVIIDMPACGAYDFYIEHPEYFMTDENNSPVIPFDWADVRLFNFGTEENPNKDLIELHKRFIDLVISLNADGIRADVARLKPACFWKELIDYARGKDSEFLFLAEASNEWDDFVAKSALSTPCDKLFEAGFDTYLGNYFNLKNWKASKELISNVQNDLKLSKKYKISVIGSFSTHDEYSPILIHGEKYSKMIIWLNTTLPLNSYYVDGFSTGDTYNYPWENKLAASSQTDDEYYFTHNGKLDLFNFSRKPNGSNYSIYDEFLLANKFKEYYSSELSNAKFIPLKSSNPSVFAYARVTNNSSIIVIGNLDFDNAHPVTVKVPKFKPSQKLVNLRVTQNLKNTYSNGKIKTTLEPCDIQVLLVKNLVF